MKLQECKVIKTCNGMEPGVYAWFDDHKEANAAKIPKTMTAQTSPPCRRADGSISQGIYRVQIG